MTSCELRGFEKQDIVGSGEEGGLGILVLQKAKGFGEAMAHLQLQQSSASRGWCESGELSNRSRIC